MELDTTKNLTNIQQGYMAFKTFETKSQVIQSLLEIENEIEMRFKKYPCFYQEYVHKTDLLKQIRSKLNF